jgi:hypothetical protein
VGHISASDLIKLLAADFSDKVAVVVVVVVLLLLL